MVDQDLSHEFRAVSNAEAPLKAELSSLHQSCAEMKGANGVLEKQNKDQQGTINNCQTQAQGLLVPAPLKISPMMWSDEVTNGVDHKTTYLILTNKLITPVSLEVLCDVSLSAGNGTIVPIGAMIGGSEIRQRRSLFVGISSPAWTPETPLRIELTYTSGRVANCVFREH